MKKLVAVIALAAAAFGLSSSAHAGSTDGYVRHVALYNSQLNSKLGGVVALILEDAYGKPLPVCQLSGTVDSSSPWNSSKMLVFVPANALTDRFLATLLTAKAQRMKIGLGLDSSLDRSIGWRPEGHCTVNAITIDP